MPIAKYDRFEVLTISHLFGNPPYQVKVLLMSSELITRQAETASEAADRVAPKPRLAEVLDQVRRDSREAADEYLNESTVPHGGE
jgi:hypothetical protein